MQMGLTKLSYGTIKRRQGCCRSICYDGSDQKLVSRGMPSNHHTPDWENQSVGNPPGPHPKGCSDTHVQLCLERYVCCQDPWFLLGKSWPNGVSVENIGWKHDFQCFEHCESSYSLLDCKLNNFSVLFSPLTTMFAGGNGPIYCLHCIHVLVYICNGVYIHQSKLFAFLNSVYKWTACRHILVWSPSCRCKSKTPAQELNLVPAKHPCE